jgi:hypothetical protein
MQPKSFCRPILIVLKCTFDGALLCHPALVEKTFHNQRGYLVSKRNSVIGWGIVILIIVGGALLAVLWPSLTSALSGQSSTTAEAGSVSLSSSTPGTVDVAALVSELGGMIGLDIQLEIEPVNTWLAFIGLSIFTVGIVVVTGVIIAVLYRLLDRIVTRTKNDEAYQTAEVELDNREKAYIKQHMEDQPPDPIPSHERARWSAVSTTLITIMFFMFGGIALGWNIAPNTAQLLMWATAFGAVGLIVSLIMFSPKRIMAVENSDNAAIPWGPIWVILSGLLIVGLGLGIVIFVVSSG